MALVIYTIGHGNLAIEEFIALLDQHKIEALIDVRSAPYSKYVPHFNQKPLHAALHAAGIKYSYAGEKLGGRPKDPALYRGGAVSAEDADRHDFLDIVDYRLLAETDTYKEGIVRLLEIAGQYRTAIMCSEENPDMCHRKKLIQRTLLARGVSVLHIRKTGKIEAGADEPEQLSLL